MKISKYFLLSKVIARWKKNKHTFLDYQVVVDVSGNDYRSKDGRILFAEVIHLQRWIVKLRQEKASVEIPEWQRISWPKIRIGTIFNRTSLKSRSGLNDLWRRFNCSTIKRSRSFCRRLNDLTFDSQVLDHRQDDDESGEQSQNV